MIQDISKLNLSGNPPVALNQTFAKANRSRSASKRGTFVISQMQEEDDVVEVEYDTKTPEALQSHTPMQNRKGSAMDTSFSLLSVLEVRHHTMRRS